MVDGGLYDLCIKDGLVHVLEVKMSAFVWELQKRVPFACVKLQLRK